MKASLALCSILGLFTSSYGYKVPCYLSNDPKAGQEDYDCEDRVKSCGYYGSSSAPANIPSGVSVSAYVTRDADTNCGDDRANNGNQPPIRRGYYYVVQWDEKDGTCHEILMQAGECWGGSVNRRYQDGNGNWQSSESGPWNYRCQGRCGDGCQGEGWDPFGTCSNWSRDCLKHDVCRYFHPVGNGVGGGDSYHCDDEYGQADDDYTACCLGSYWWSTWLCNRCELYDSNRNNLQSSSSCDNPGQCSGCSY